jgi:alanine dehydrogenase
MLIGVPKEIKNNEFRVGLTPASVREVCAHGHTVYIEKNAGMGIGASDQDYTVAGATIIDTAAEVFSQADMIIKVKEPQAQEYKLLREEQILFTFLHLAPDPTQTKALIKSGAVCIAYETVTAPGGGLPLLAPMSKVAGRLAVQAGAHHLEQPQGGLGKILGGVPGVQPAKVVIIGAGMVGTHATHIAVGMGADVFVLDNNPATLEKHWQIFKDSTNTIYSNNETLEQHVLSADLVIGAVLVAGAKSPKLVSAGMVKEMQSGAVMVDVAIDQGGCFETSHATTHAEPTFSVDGVIHYCVSNMPGAVPRTSAYALNNATLPFVLAIANKGYKQALLDDQHLRDGLNIIHGKVTNKEVADSLGYTYTLATEALAPGFLTSHEE